MWRAADEALLARLEDERILARVWAIAAPGAEPLHPRAAGMIRLLRDRPDAAEAIAAAERGHAGRLLAQLSPARLGGWSPALVHHVALFHRARTEHALSRDLRGSEALDGSLVLVMAAWLALGAESAYLAALARDVIGGALPAAEARRATEQASVRGIEAVGASAREGLDARSEGAARALHALARADDAIAAAEISGPLAERARARAEGLRAELVSALLAPSIAEIEELAARDWSAADVAAALERARDAWRWAGEEIEVERFLVRELPRFAWDLYRARRWEDLRSLLRPLQAPSDRLAQRIERDPAQIAWAAQCAQVLVFRAELAPTLDAQIELAERGLRLCPTLRNARLVLADLLCARAERRLEGPALLHPASDRSEARRDVERAESIFPELSRLPAVREKLARRGGGR